MSLAAHPRPRLPVGHKLNFEVITLEFTAVTRRIIPAWNFYGCIVDELAALQQEITHQIFPAPWDCILRNVRMTLDAGPSIPFFYSDMVLTLRALDETMEDFEFPSVQFDVLSSSEQVRLARGTITYANPAPPISQETSTTQADLTLTS